jgi:16S rRNA pseudouridine516 synthase
VPKVYEVMCTDVVTSAQVQQLLGGVVLNDDFKPVVAAACERVAERHVRLTLMQGKYHQVKRMLAAVGNQVESLHRSAFGRLVLPDDLAPGTWRWVTPAQRADLEKPH